MSKTELITKLIKENKITFEEALVLMDYTGNTPWYYNDWTYRPQFSPMYTTCTCGTSSANCNCNK